MINFVDIHTHQLNKKGIFLYQEDFNDFSNQTSLFSVGIHPCNVGQVCACFFDDLQNSITNIKPIALGEIGLDRSIEIPIELQLEALEKQIQMALVFKLPIIFHCVRAYDILLRLKKKYKPINIWVIHGFVKSSHLANQLIEAGFYLSFGSALLTNQKLMNVYNSVDITATFLETDTCTDVTIEAIYKKASQIKKIELSVLKSLYYTKFAENFKS